MSRLLLATLVTVTLSGFAAIAIAAEDPIKTTPADQLDWAVTTEGVAFAPLIGDRFSEAYMAMVRLPAGLVSPPHIKSANMFGLVVEGTMIHHKVADSPDGAQALSQGSFYKIPKDLAHISSCISEIPCVTFLYQDGKFDFLPVAQ